MKRTICCLLFISILHCSCYTYRIYPDSQRTFHYTGAKKEAVILNPELSEEYRIMKAGGIFNLVSGSSVDTILKIRLQPLKKHSRSAPGAFVWIVLIGQIPMRVTDDYEFEFTEIHGTDSTTRHYSLNIAMHYWFWDMLVFHKRFEEKAGQSLLANYYGK